MEEERITGRHRGSSLLAVLLMLLSSWYWGSGLAGSASLDDEITSGYSFKEFLFDHPKPGPSIVQVDPKNDDVWVALARAGKLGRWREGRLREYSLPQGSFPVGLTIDSYGRIWYSDIRRNRLGRLDPLTGAVKDFEVPTPDSWSFFIAQGPQGRFWFTQRMGNQIGYLDPDSGEVVEIPVPTPDCQPAGLAITPEGQVFFTENSGNKVGRYDPETETLVEYPVPTPMTPSPFYGLAGIASDPEGNIWFAEVDGRLGYLANGSTEILEIPVPNPASRPAGVAIDQWGLVWFTELDGNHISSYNPGLKEFRRYPIPTGKPDPQPMGPPEVTARGDLPIPGFTAKTSRPFGIAADSQGNIWFSEQYAHKLGVLVPPKVEVFQPSGILSEPDSPLRIQLRLPQGDFKVRYSVDGREVDGSSALDLTTLGPGGHAFAVHVSDSAGEPVFEAGSEFVVNPEFPYLLALVERAQDDGRIGAKAAGDIERSLRMAQAKAKQGQAALAQEMLRNLNFSLRARPGVSPDLADQLSSHLLYREAFGVREHEVRILDKAPYFEPAEMVIEAGDRVRWVFESDQAPPNGRKVRFYALNGDFASPQLSPGQQWGRPFPSEGEYGYVSNSVAGMEGKVTVRPRTISMLEFPLPGPGRVPGVLKVDPQGNVWFTEGGGGFAHLTDIELNNRIGRLRPDGTIEEHQTPTPASGPTSLDVAPDGSVWFSQRAGNNLGKLDPVSGKITEYPLPTPLSGAVGVCVDPSGTVWFTEKVASRIGSFDPLSETFAEYDTPTPNSQPSTVISDAQGTIWFDQRANDRIVSLDPASGRMREYSIPSKQTSVIGLVPDNKGHVWFLELAGNKVGRLEIETGTITEYAIPTSFAAPFKMVIDPAGRIWFTQAMGNRIGLLDQGRVREFAIPTPSSMPGGIAMDGEGNIWFTQQAANKVAKIPLGDINIAASASAQP